MSQENPKSLKLPSKVYIGYRDYDVNEMLEEEKGTHIGFHHGQYQYITINTDGKPNEVVNTLLHEILHGVLDMAGFCFEGEDDEECIVNSLGNGLTQVLRDNPDVINWMLTTLNAKQLQ